MDRDWIHIAKAAGEHGISYPTNARMEEFLSSVCRDPNDSHQELLGMLQEAFETLKLASRQLTEDHRMVLAGRSWGGRTLAKLEGFIAKHQHSA